MKAAIVYASTHHGNTRKLVEAIAKDYPVTLIDAEAVPEGDLSGYGMVGFASGIAWGRFYSSVEGFASACLPAGMPVCFLYTCAADSRDFAAGSRGIAAARNAVCMETYACRGFNTYGPWKLLGGMNKGHPDAGELRGASEFFGRMLEAAALRKA